MNKPAVTAEHPDIRALTKRIDKALLMGYATFFTRIPSAWGEQEMHIMREIFREKGFSNIQFCYEEPDREHHRQPSADEKIKRAAIQITLMR